MLDDVTMQTVYREGKLFIWKYGKFAKDEEWKEKRFKGDN